MVIFPPCKINLGLNILRKRPDGFHDIETCFYPVPWTDVLEIIPSKEFSFSQTGIGIPGSPGDNLCVKAYELVRERHPVGAVSIHLHKLIPSGAGLGGGSSDAATTVRMLNDIFELQLHTPDLQRYASELGSDCAFFIEPRVKFGSQRGNILENIPVSLKGKFLIIIKPDIHISTAEAYAAVTPRVPSGPLKDVLQREPLEAWKDKVKNDFEDGVFQKFPLLEAVKRKFYDSGALYASMSGSGAAVYGIFNSSIDLKNAFDGVVYWSGVLTE
jgi:4-diphosphocytidyl-2-C-methyl-D-erythritol kinase